MRFAVGVLALSLLAPLVRAEDTQPSEPIRSVSAPSMEPRPSERPPEPTRPSEPASRSKVPLRVVRVMPESRQALLYNRARATHVLAEVGRTVDGYAVEDIDDDVVILSRDGQLIVLAAPERARVSDEPALRVRSAAVRPIEGAGALAPVDPYGPYAPLASNAPVDPYAPSAASAPVDPYAARAADAPVDPHGSGSSVAPVDPYGEPPIRSVRAPDAERERAAAPRVIEPGEGGVRVVEAPSTPSPSAPNTPARTSIAGAPAGAAGAPLAVTLSRREVDAALANFGALSTAIRGSFSAGGLIVDEVNERSLLYRAGLRAGDIITTVDGVRLHALDDAANLYARAATARAITAQVIRGGKPVTLHVVIQ